MQIAQLSRPPSRTWLAGLALPALLLAACSAGAEQTTADAAEVSVTEDSATSHQEEAATARPRLVTAYDGGMLVVDALTLEVITDLPLEGFNRLAPAGDGRHVLVSHTATEAGWHVLDTGAWTQAHGDHAHHYTASPVLTGAVFAAVTPGHAVPHGGVTLLFDDGTGDITAFDPAELSATDGELPEATVLESEAAHHGVAVRLSDGTTVATLGTEDSRSGIRLLASDGTETARDEDCPGVHGEGVAADEVVVVGCEDGVLLVRDGDITKITSPTAFGRIGNQYVRPDSTVAVGDYKSDPEQGLVLHQISLVDTASGRLSLVDLPTGVGYTWRGVGRGPAGEALVLGTDGTLAAYDEVTGAALSSWALIDPWEAPEEWQLPHPSLTVLDETAYVTDPASRTIQAVDLVTGEVWATATLPTTPNEVVVVTG